MEEPFDLYIHKANQAAMAGSWEKTLEYLLFAEKIQPENVELLNAIGGTYIQLGRIEDALTTFARVVNLTPDSSAAHQNLAAVYRLLGKWAEAEQAYRHALERNNEDRTAWKGLSYVCLQQGNAVEGVEILAALVKSDPQDTEAMVMLAECYEEGEDLESARMLYEKTLSIEPDNETAKDGLKRIEKQLEWSSANKLSELSQKLAALKQKSPSSVPDYHPVNGKSGSQSSSYNIAIFGPPQVPVEIRFAPMVQCMLRSGLRVKVSAHFDPANLSDVKTTIFSRVHLSDELSTGFETCKQMGVKVVLDMDDDFITPSRAPQVNRNDHQGYLAISRLQAFLRQADVVTVPNEQLVEVYQPYAQRIVVIPYSWDEHNPMWKKSAPRRSHFQIGFVSGHTQPEDLKVCLNAVTKLLKEDKTVLVGVVADLNLYSALEGIPDEQKFYLPPGKLEDYPFLLANFDILLFPLADTPYNQHRSDLPLMEAGAREVPWIASPIPAFEAWQEGGLISDSESSWEQNLQTCLQSKEICQQLAQAGAEKALIRQADLILNDWLEVLEHH